MPRPRTASDEQILQAATRAMARLGPSDLTLADVAREAGLSPAALVKRFGSKRGLLLAVSRAGASGMDACFEMVREKHASPLAALVAAATDFAAAVKTPDEMGNHLAFLQIDVCDPDFREPMRQMSRDMLRGYERLLDEAVAADELRKCDTRALARVLNATVGGSMIAWAVFRTGTAKNWVKKDVETLLAPYRTT